VVEPEGKRNKKKKGEKNASLNREQKNKKVFSREYYP